MPQFQHYREGESLAPHEKLLISTDFHKHTAYACSGPYPAMTAQLSARMLTVGTNSTESSGGHFPSWGISHRNAVGRHRRGTLEGSDSEISDGIILEKRREFTEIRRRPESRPRRFRPVPFANLELAVNCVLQVQSAPPAPRTVWTSLYLIPSDCARIPSA
jgi:hypothetical protein